MNCPANKKYKAYMLHMTLLEVELKMTIKDIDFFNSM